MVKTTKAFRIAMIAFFIAIIFIQNYIPIFSYLPIGPINITTIPITIIIVSIILGPKYGSIAGGTWGLLSFTNAIFFPTNPIQALVFSNPIISVIPRILMGFLTGLCYIGLKKTKINKELFLTMTGIIGTLLNVILVMGTIYMLYQTPNAAHTYGVSNPSMVGKITLTTAITAGVPEIILSAIIVPIVTTPLLKLIRQNNS